MKILHIDSTHFYEMPYRSMGQTGSSQFKTLPFYRVEVDKLPGNLTSCIALSGLLGREYGARNRLAGEFLAEELVLLQEMKAIPEIDLILLAGNFFCYPDFRPLTGTGDVTSVWTAFAKRCKAVTGVLGKHDSIEADKMPENALILDGASTGDENLKIAGLPGIIDRSSEQNQVHESLSRVISKSNEIVVLHQSPKGPGDKQDGSCLVRDYLKTEGAGLVISGNCFWDQPLVTIGENQVLNVDNKLFLFTERILSADKDSLKE